MIYSDNTVAIFTIHFATINTEEMYSQIIPKLVFTIHFATINTSLVIRPEDQVKYLQYTLLLLILTPAGNLSFVTVKFTIHFATINTKT